MSVRSEPPRDDRVGLYVHVPVCQSKCGYCGFYSEPAAGHDLDRLVSALVLELDRYADVAGIGTLYVGGGSPTCLPVVLLGRLLEAVRRHGPAAREFTVECNPGQVDAGVLAALRQFGVNRLSFGVQSFHAADLALLGRRHSADDAVRAIRLAQDYGFENVGLDLIFAIPGSTVESWTQNLESAVALDVRHISAYSLSLEEGTALHRAVRAGEVVPIDEEVDLAMYELAIDYLASAGFDQYEISNFARAGFACEHNRGYWENRPYVGVGPAAASYLHGVRTTNISDIREYARRMEFGLSAIERSERLDEEGRTCETAVLNLRMRRGIDPAVFRAATGAEFAEVFAAPLERYRREGLIEVEAGRVRLARRALAVADSVLCDFSSF